MVAPIGPVTLAQEGLPRDIIRRCTIGQALRALWCRPDWCPHKETQVATWSLTLLMPGSALGPRARAMAVVPHLPEAVMPVAAAVRVLKALTLLGARP